MIRRSLLLLMFVLVLPGCRANSGIQVSDAWVRTAGTGENSAAYFILENSGAADNLLAVESAAAEEVQLHRSTTDDQGLAHMDQQEQVEVPASAKVIFEPGGLHAMLISLRAGIEPGEIIEINLIFENHETIRVEAQVRSP